jgi:glycosyltransferase involved in cell wall biosynthesis
MKENISVIIPTYRRPYIVLRAVHSALMQTYKDIEVIVVIDGPDETSVKALERINDSRLTLLVLPENVGGSEARNAGVRAAKSDWIAFLDDDDEWVPEKLAKQLETAIRLQTPFPVVSSFIIAKTPSGNFIYPRRIPRLGEPISEYLWVRNSFFYGEGLLPTPTLLVKKQLLELVPFRKGLRKHQDWDWVLQVAQLEGVLFKIVPEPLAICYLEESRISVSTEKMWRWSLEWIRENRDLVTPRAYASFVATQVAPQASWEWKTFVPLLREMYRFGEPRAMDLCLYLCMWFVPINIRRLIRTLFIKIKSGKN